MKDENKPDGDVRPYSYTHEALKAGGGNSQTSNSSNVKTFSDKRWFTAPFVEAKNWDVANYAQWVDILFAGMHQDFPPPVSSAPPKDYLIYVHRHLPTQECKSKLVSAFRDKVFNLGDKTPKWVHSLPTQWLPK